MNRKLVFQMLVTLRIRLNDCLSRPRLSSQRRSLILALLFSTLFVPLTHAADITLAWDHNDQTSVTGFYVYHGLESGNYSTKIDAGSGTQYTLVGLDDLKSYYISVTAYNEFGESDFSGEIIYASYACQADIDFDGDIDGSDLMLYAEDTMNMNLSTFVAKYGMTDCP